MIPYLVIFAAAFFIGWFLRGCVSRTAIARLQNQHQEAVVITKIEAERLKQDRMIRERMQ